MLSSLFIILAAIFNACMDRVENENFYTSVFKKLNKNFWYKRESWETAYKIFGYKFDFWHLSKSAMVISLCLAIALYVPILGTIDFVIFGLLWNLTFNLFYNKILKRL
jgi:hypothetical protein